jgi:single-strand DNA-binding protein
MRNQAVTVTVVGWAGNTPKQVIGEGVPFTSFRVSARERRYDARTQEWVDVRTEWFTVKAFRDLAFNLAASVRSGDPVVVTGRLRTEEWQGKDGPRTGLVIDADAVGHDLSLGSAVFARTIHRSEPEPAGETVAPEEDPWATEPGADQATEDEPGADREPVPVRAREA